MGVMNAFKLTPAPEAVMAATRLNSMAEGLGLETSTSSYMYFEDANNDGVVDFIPLVKLTSSGELALDNNQIQIRNYCLGWMERVVTGQLPASHFMKTQYTIQQVDIPLLELARNSYFHAHPELYEWPDGTSSEVAYSSLPWQIPFTDGLAPT